MIEFTSWIQVPYKYWCIHGSDSRYFIPIYMFWTFRNPKALNHWHSYYTPNQLSCQPPAIALLASVPWKGIDKSPRYCYDEKRKGEYSHMQSYNQDQILNRIRPQLINIQEGDNRISFFCPFCQSTGIKSNGKKWHPSQRKAYILVNQESGYEFYVFYCQNTHCQSRFLSTSMKGGLSLENFSRHILGDIPSQRNQAPHRLNTVHCKKPSAKQSSHSSSGGHSGQAGPIVQMIPRPTPAQQAGQGSSLAKKVAQRKEARKSYWELF